MIILAPEAILAACIECTLRSSSKIFGEIISGRTLFINKGFMLDDIVYQTASKFAIFLEKENPNSFFFIFHFEQLPIFNSGWMPSLIMVYV